MKKPEEKRIYVIVAATIQVASIWYEHNGVRKPKFSPPKTVVQPSGRQFAQGCHVVSNLRHKMLRLNEDPSKIPTLELINVGYSLENFIPLTTIILQARDSAEMGHVHLLLIKKKLEPVIFLDTNPEYGPGSWPTAVAVFAAKKQIQGILDYLPLWGSK